jgi:NAD(P)-dependent dehydrogenase (short-subunit alcohol dehydrogenase family)
LSARPASQAKRAVVTGGSGGIGRAVAKALAARGWRLTLLAREPVALEEARLELAGEGHETLLLDVSDESAWARLAPKLGEVHGLVCAAARLPPVGPIGSYEAADFKRTIEVNLIGTLLAIQACLPGLRTAGGAVVTFSGGGATRPLPKFDAYATSKAAVARLSENLAVDLASEGVQINCVAPGFVATAMHDSTLAAGPELAGTDYHERTRSELERGGVPASEAAELVCLLLDADPETPFTGKLISAQWDDWRDPDFRRRLATEPDLGTLRRIDDNLFSAATERADA